MPLRSSPALLALGFLLLCSDGAQADPLDDSSAAALRETLRTLPSGAGAKAPGADPRLGAVASSAELYAVAGAVFQELAERYGGDPAKMSAALERARTDPEGFASSLSPVTRAQLRALADKVPATE